jgi:hypothetical protein
MYMDNQLAKHCMQVLYLGFHQLHCGSGDCSFDESDDEV